MAVTPVDINIAKQKAFNFVNAISPKDPLANMLLSALFQWLGQHKGNPDLLAVSFATANAADTVIADDPCKLYAVIYTKGSASTTAAFLQISDHDSAVQSEEEIRVEIGATENKVQVLIFGHGKPYATGITLHSATTAAGGTKSATADIGSGLLIIGAP